MLGDFGQIFEYLSPEKDVSMFFVSNKLERSVLPFFNLDVCGVSQLGV